MATQTKKQTATVSVNAKPKKKRPGQHKKKVSSLKSSKNYVKKYKGQGR
jgi:hypothetical protein